MDLAKKYKQCKVHLSRKKEIIKSLLETLQRQNQINQNVLQNYWRSVTNMRLSSTSLATASQFAKSTASK